MMAGTVRLWDFPGNRLLDDILGLYRYDWADAD